jgi:hypothetical protein
LKYFLPRIQVESVVNETTVIELAGIIKAAKADAYVL